MVPIRGNWNKGGRTTNQFPPESLTFFRKDITETEACILVWTDGSGRPPKRDEDGNVLEKFPAGWAFVGNFKGAKIERSGQLQESTVNEAELTAIIRALEFVKLTTDPLIIYTDSSYAKHSLLKWGPEKRRTGEWVNALGMPTANREVIERGLDLLQHHRSYRTVLIRKVKGHSGIEGNERADFLCGLARKGLKE